MQRVSLIEEGPVKHVRMANLAIVGSHSTNGVSAIHSELLRTTTVKDLAEIFPERFSNKTNGVTPRRWLLLANQPLARVITDAIGDGWITDLSELSKLKPLAGDKGVRDGFRKAKREAKSEFAAWLKSDSGQIVDPDSIFDCHIKRIHEYKRQLLNALRIVVLYNRLRENPKLEDGAAHIFLRRQGGARLPARQTHHQVHREHGGYDRCGPRDAGPAQGSVSAGIRCNARRAADPRQRCLEPNLDRRL